MRGHPVSQRVNSPKNDDPEVMAEAQTDLLFGDDLSSPGDEGG